MGNSSNLVDFVLGLVTSSHISRVISVFLASVSIVDSFATLAMLEVKLILWFDSLPVLGGVLVVFLLFRMCLHGRR